MKIKFIILLLFSIIIGFISAKLVYSIYDEVKNNYNAYILQSGVYSNEQSLSEKIEKLDSFIIKKEDDLSFVYVGVTSNKENANKIKNIYKNKNIEIYIKPIFIGDTNFYTSLAQYDILLSSVEKESDILSINNIILSDYEQLVLKS